MGLDIRLPIGMMFSLLGVMLSGYGFFTKSNVEMYKHSLDININIVWGAVLMVFGVYMLISAYRAAQKAKTEQKK